TVAPRDHTRPEPAVLRGALEILDAVIEDVGAAVDLIEEPAEIAARDERHRVEKIVRPGMLEAPPREVRRQDRLERRPPEPPLERVEPQRGLRIRHPGAGDPRREERVAWRRRQ